MDVCFDIFVFETTIVWNNEFPYSEVVCMSYNSGHLLLQKFGFVILYSIKGWYTSSVCSNPVLDNVTHIVISSAYFGPMLY